MATDANGKTTQFEYDRRHRLVTIVFPDETTITNAYDGSGNLISRTDQAGRTVTFTYDAANQLRTMPRQAVKPPHRRGF